MPKSTRVLYSYLQSPSMYIFEHSASLSSPRSPILYIGADFESVVYSIHRLYFRSLTSQFHTSLDRIFYVNIFWLDVQVYKSLRVDIAQSLFKKKNKLHKLIVIVVYYTKAICRRTVNSCTSVGSTLESTQECNVPPSHSSICINILFSSSHAV